MRLRSLKLTPTERLRANRLLAQQDKKSCSRCNKIKSLDEFASRQPHKNCTRTECRDCLKEKVRAEVNEHRLYQLLQKEGLTLDQKPKALSWAAKKKLNG